MSLYLTLTVQTRLNPQTHKAQMNFVEVQEEGKKELFIFSQFGFVALLMQYGEILQILPESWDM